MTSQVDCGVVRQALGVYVVGAIEPAERAVVDAHLSGCADCRAELASLAGLPALLGRIPVGDAARLADGVLLRDLAGPSPGLLQSLLRRVAAERRARRWRGVAAAAAAVVIAVGGGVAGGLAASHAAGPTPAVSTAGQARASNPATRVSALVAYSPTTWGGTAMRVQVSGIPAGTKCRFWVVTNRGSRVAAGVWTVGGLYGGPWYPAASSVAVSAVHSFQITAAGKLLVTVPA